MPASYLHEVIALDAHDRLRQQRSALDGLLAEHRAALLTGSQGPDIFFFYKYLQSAENKKALALGNRLHSEHTSAFLLALLKHAQAGGDAARAYALGFLTHYAADTTVHPFVYARAFDREGRNSINLHCGLEAAMDTAAFHRQGGRGVPRQMNGIAALPPREAEEIAAALAGAVNEVFPESATSAEVARGSLRWALFITRLLHSPTGIKYRLLAWLFALAGKPGMVEAHALPRKLPAHDYANRAGLAWSSPWTPDQPSRQSLAELTNAATERAKALMEQAEALWHGETTEAELGMALGDLHYDSGLRWQETAELADGQPAQEVAHA